MSIPPKSTLNFSGYSNTALKEALNSINRDKFPENYKACLEEIHSRQEKGLWVEDDGKSSTKTVGPYAYIVALTSFIPGFGVVTGLVSIAYGLIHRSRGGLKLVFIGVCGILVTVMLRWFFFHQIKKPSGLFAETQIKLLSEHVLPDLVRRIEYHKVQSGQYPRSLAELGSEVTNLKELPNINAFGEIYFELEHDHYYLLVPGPDKIPFTKDDILPNLNQSELEKIGFRTRSKDNS